VRRSEKRESNQLRSHEDNPLVKEFTSTVRKLLGAKGRVGQVCGCEEFNEAAGCLAVSDEKFPTIKCSIDWEEACGY
jgi:hypothetical protein